MITTHLIFFQFFDGAGSTPVVSPTGKSRAHKKETRRDIDWNVDYVNLHKKIETKIETLEKAKEQVLEKKVKVPKVDVNVIVELEEEIENLVKLLDYLDTKLDYPKYQYKKKETRPLFTFSKDELYKNKNLLDSLESTVKKKAKDEKIKKILDMLYKTGIL